MGNETKFDATEEYIICPNCQFNLGEKKEYRLAALAKWISYLTCPRCNKKIKVFYNEENNTIDYEGITI